MASIQQSLNQMLSSVAGIAAAGSYIHSQSPKYQSEQNTKEARRLGKEIQQLKSKKELTPTELEGLKIAENRYNELVGSAYAYSPTMGSASGLDIISNEGPEKPEGEVQEMPARTEGRAYGGYRHAYGDAWDKQKRATQKQYDVATENALESITRKTDTQREMVASLATRFDELSAKEKRQILDVAHKLNKKGGNN